MDLLLVTSNLRTAFQHVARVIEGDQERLSVSALLQYCADTTPSAFGTLIRLQLGVVPSINCVCVDAQWFEGVTCSSTFS